MTCRDSSCHFTSCHAVPCRDPSRRVMPCRVLPCRVVQCHAVPCHVTSRYVMSYYPFFTCLPFPSVPASLAGSLDWTTHGQMNGVFLGEEECRKRRVSTPYSLHCQREPWHPQLRVTSYCHKAPKTLPSLQGSEASLCLLWPSNQARDTISVQELEPVTSESQRQCRAVIDESLQHSIL